jgi:predicted Zn finger-like uncharacterized protein
MEVSCPNCFTSYTVSPEKIPDKGVSPTCKKCGVTFTIVRASGDPLKDRANRMKGYVVLRERNSLNGLRTAGTSSREGSHKKPMSLALFEKKGFKLGVCLAGAAVLLFAAGFSGWKHHVHKHFEESVRISLEQASNGKFALVFEDMSFSAFGGLKRDAGCIHGLSLTDQQTQKRLPLADEIHFKLDPLRKHFITKPFDFHLKDRGLEITLNRCVIEAQETRGWSLDCKVDQAIAGPEGFPLFTAEGMEMFFRFRGGDWEEDPRFLMGDADVAFKVEHMGSLTTTVGRDMDILVSIKNGLFVKDDYGADTSTGNYFNNVATKWGNLGTVLSVDHCSINILGSSVQLTGKLAFHDPIGESELDLHLGAKDFSHIMRYIHQTNEQAFDKIISALVALDERQADAYEQSTDVLDLNLSYRNSRIEINEQEVGSFI